MTSAADIVLLPDAGPLITLAYADGLDLLCRPGWPIKLVDMVWYEVTRHETPTSQKLTQWMNKQSFPILQTKIGQHYRHTVATDTVSARKANLGEMAIQEAMHELALATPPQTGVFLFEDHKIARASFMLPDNCRKVSTRAFLIFLEQKGWLDSAAEVEHKAILAGRQFSRLRFPPT